MTTLPPNKTKIVATIGPASDAPDMLERLIRAGMNVARLNFSHGDFTAHAARIAHIRAAALAANRRVAILADLPGPKMRIGRIDPEPVTLRAGDAFALTTDDVVGDARRVSVSFDRLPEVVKRGDLLFLNDGIVQLRVDRTAGCEVQCAVVVGGELRSRKGLNLPGIALGLSAFTPHDRDCLAFALENGVDAVSQSFVEGAADVEAVRKASAELGGAPFVVAKIERAGALANIDEILAAADGIMVARGDLGVEVPLEQIALTQKDLIARANRAGKPVITATQMLESMTASRLPTRAEATDVANAILDGTDCLMLSAESAAGAFPEESVAMLARIAAFTEPRRPPLRIDDRHARALPAPKAIASVVESALRIVDFGAVFVPTRSGTTARMISSFKPPVWIVAVGAPPAAASALQLSYGVHAVSEEPAPGTWRDYAGRFLRAHHLAGSLAILVAGPSPHDPEANHRIEFLRVDDPESGSRQSP